MKAILAIATLALIVLTLEDRAREVAGDAKVAYGEAVDTARDATQSLGRSVERKPFMALLIAGAGGYVLARLTRLL